MPRQVEVDPVVHSRVRAEVEQRDRRAAAPAAVENDDLSRARSHGRPGTAATAPRSPRASTIRSPASPGPACAKSGASASNAIGPEPAGAVSVRDQRNSLGLTDADASPSATSREQQPHSRTSRRTLWYENAPAISSRPRPTNEPTR